MVYFYERSTTEVVKVCSASGICITCVWGCCCTEFEAEVTGCMIMFWSLVCETEVYKKSLK